MKDLGLFISQVDPRNLPEAEYAPTLAFMNAIRAERLPDDPPISLEEHIVRLRNIPPFVAVTTWYVREAENTPIIASGHIAITHAGHNEHVAEFGIEVLPEFRRRGIARRLLAPLADTARATSRTLMMSGSSDHVPAGGAFLERIGATPGLIGHTNQLNLADLDRALLREWEERATERCDAAGFELAWIDGPCPEDFLDAAVEMINAVSEDVPLGDLEMESFKMTPEQLRQSEASMFATGTERWVALARERATGAPAGVTEVTWNPHRSYLVHQGITGVLPAFRQRGLGRWLKAAMLSRILAERPDVRFVRTHNADSNAAMLSINKALGFKPYFAETFWQVPTDQVFAYLQGNGTPGDGLTGSAASG